MKNIWKYIVFSLLVGIMAFHMGVLWVIHGNQYELTSKDYYAREMNFESTMQQKRAARNFNWRYHLEQDPARFTLHISDAQNQTAEIDRVKVSLVRPDAAGLDREFELSRDESGTWSAPMTQPRAGRWNVAITAYRNSDVLLHESKDSF